MVKCNWSVPYTLTGINITHYIVGIINKGNVLINQTTLFDTYYVHDITKTDVVNLSISVTAIAEWKLRGETEQVHMNFDQSQGT